MILLQLKGYLLKNQKYKKKNLGRTTFRTRKTLGKYVYVKDIVPQEIGELFSKYWFFLPVLCTKMIQNFTALNWTNYSFLTHSSLKVIIHSSF